MVLSLFCNYDHLSPYKKSKKSDEQLLRKTCYGQTDRPLSAKTGVQKSVFIVSIIKKLTGPNLRDESWILRLALFIYFCSKMITWTFIHFSWNSLLCLEVNRKTKIKSDFPLCHSALSPTNITNLLLFCHLPQPLWDYYFPPHIKGYSDRCNKRFCLPALPELPVICWYLKWIRGWLENEVTYQSLN